MHPMTRAVDELAGREKPYRSGLLEREMFSRPEDVDRILEVLQLARQQVSDDTASMARHAPGKQGVDRVGRAYVEHVGQEYAGMTTWQKWTPEQVALEAGLAPYLGRLTDYGRDVLRLLYHAGLSERATGQVLGGVGGDAIHHAKTRALDALRRALTEAFLTEPDVDLTEEP